MLEVLLDKMSLTKMLFWINNARNIMTVFKLNISSYFNIKNKLFIKNIQHR